MYNWGTVDPAEVNRLLFEYIGWEQANADPGLTVLKPHANADRDILLPTRYVKDSSLPVDQTHTIKVTKPVDPPVAIRIERLSRWFIPGKEKCDLVYSLEGLAANANKVQFAVYGSNYTAAGDWNDGFVKFAAAPTLADARLYTNMEKVTAPERGLNLSIDEWKGTVNTTSGGALGKKNPANKDRVINAAFSPYTAHLRYYRDDADRTCRLEMDSFWPLFDATTGAATADSLKIRFAIRGTDRMNSTMGGGTLQVYDGNGDLVYREPVSLANLAKKDAGFNEVAWNGDYSPHTKMNSAGTAKVVAADMPYRVQMQVHTGPGQDKGLALAAMSTEVRIYVHPQTHPLTLNPYVANTDQPSLHLQCKREVLSVKEDLKRADGDVWVLEQLARAGFHPGPVENSVPGAFTTALSEFKRSQPKRKNKVADPFTRLPINALSSDADVLNALEDFAADATRHRPWFGKPAAGRPNLDFDSDELQTRLRDPNDELIVWVDDRHYYTDPTWITGVAPKGADLQTALTTHEIAMGNYARAYTDGDVVNSDKDQWVARPWIPLVASPVLLSKGQGLNDIVAPPSEDDRKIMAEAVGSLRIDWSFDEIDDDPVVEGIINTAMYDPGVTRAKKLVEHVRNDKKEAAYARKDVVKTCAYSNAPDLYGGVRPPVAADYYKAMYAQGAESLAPWKAEAVTATETIVTITHDNTGQADDKLAVKRLGAAGIYFRPSTIGGDGMRLRAQVRFSAANDYQFPNLPVLEKRYPRLPQVQTSKLRVWRKASLRGYISWGPNTNWVGTRAAMLRHFDAAYLHFEEEKGSPVGIGSITDYFKNNDSFKDVVRRALDTSGAASAADKLRAKSSNIALHAQRLWPWYGAKQFGIFEPATANQDMPLSRKEFIDIMSSYFFLLSNLYGMEWIKDLEGRTGKLRGHIICEFQAGDDFFMQQYVCVDCALTYWFVERKEGDSQLKAPCPSGCGGKLARTTPSYNGYYTCPNGHQYVLGEANGQGNEFAGFFCNRGACNGAGVQITADASVRTAYSCDKCRWTEFFPAGTNPANEACYASSQCEGKMQLTAGAGLFLQTYTCNKCAAEIQMSETTALGGSHNGRSHGGCPKLISGKLAPKAGGVVSPVSPNVRLEITKTVPSGYNSIPVPSLGNPLGISLDSAAGHELWAHELAHNRYLEHSGNAPGANASQHDSTPNQHAAFAAIGETEAGAKNWDRACLMTYVSHLATYQPARDKQYMCGKCLLKVRGWQVQAVALPAGNVHD